MSDLTSIAELRRKAELGSEVLEAVRNPRADAIADEVERLGGALKGPDDDRAHVRSLFRYIYLRLIGQDIDPAALIDAHIKPFILHPDQRGAVVLHPVAVGPDYMEALFIDPNGTGKWRLSLERVDEPQ